MDFFKKTFELLSQLGMLPGGSAARVLKFLLIISDLITLLLLVIFIFAFFLLKKGRGRTVILILVILGSLFLLAQAALYIDMAFIEPNWIKVEYVNIRIPRLGKLVKEQKIVQFSDLHTLRFGFREKQLIKKIKAIKPDLILFTGGFTGEDLKNLGDAIPEAAKVFSALKAPLGIWAVTDDTDDVIFHDDPPLKQQLKDAGVRFLDNENREFVNRKGDSFWLVGTEDAFYGKSGLHKAIFMLPVEEPKILLTHSPNIIDEASEYGIDLVVVGKTHGGQIGIKALRDISDFIKNFKYISGLYKVENTYLYVNRGIGGKTSPYRLLCRPEITVLNITE